jgi:hypothetical protein
MTIKEIQEYRTYAMCCLWTDRLVVHCCRQEVPLVVVDDAAADDDDDDDRFLVGWLYYYSSDNLHFLCLELTACDAVDVSVMWVEVMIITEDQRWMDQ